MDRIPTSQLLVFAAPVMGVFMAGALINFYLLKFSTDVLLIAPAVVGTILLAARIWDAVTDPAVGWLSDRTRSPMGRRRPWLLGSAVPIGGAVLMLWSPPESLEGTALSVWLAVAVLLFYTAYTGFRVPHVAFAAELARGYHDRTRVFGMLQALESVGMIFSAVALFLLESAEDPRTFARTLALVMGLVTASIILLPVLFVRERPEYQGRGGKNPFASYRDVLTNRNARILIWVIFLEHIGFGALVALLPYLSDYVILSPGRTALYLFGAVGSMLLSIPLWVVLSRRFGKKRVWMVTLGFKVAIFASVLTIGEGDWIQMLVTSMTFGFMNGSGAVLAQSLKADVIDSDEARTGERKEGSFFAAWNFVQKAAAGVAIWLIGIVLSMTGFVPNVAQNAQTVLGITLLASALPLVLHVVAMAILAGFSLDQEQHSAAVEEAAARQA